MLRDLAGRRVPVHDRLEKMADDRMQDDQPMRKDPEKEPYTQKRRVQRLHQLEIIEEEQEQTLNKKGVKSQV